uniref:Uncharacterized protein n=1 Tax=Solanum lycopersicum TaxID=4081 RepID=A0A3Q7G5G6_SOLLC
KKIKGENPSPPLSTAAQPLPCPSFPPPLLFPLPSPSPPLPLFSPSPFSPRSDQQQSVAGSWNLRQQLQTEEVYIKTHSGNYLRRRQHHQRSQQKLRDPIKTTPAVTDYNHNSGQIQQPRCCSDKAIHITPKLKIPASSTSLPSLSLNRHILVGVSAEARRSCPKE